MANALGDISTTKTLLADQLGTANQHITTAYIDNIVPHPVSAPDTLQEVCDTGNTTTTDINMTTGKLNMTSGSIEMGSGGLEMNSGNVELSSGDIELISGDIRVDAGDLQTTTGRVLTDEVSAITPNRTLTLKTYVKSLKVRHEIVAPSVIIPDDCAFGNIVQIRSGTAPSTFTLPRWVEGGHFSIINSSGNAQRFVAAAFETLDGQPPPTFISITAAPPFCLEVRAGGNAEWWVGQY
jgi:hypothetical protein